MATNKTYPCLTADAAAVLIPNGAMVAVSGFTLHHGGWHNRRFGLALVLRTLGYVAASLDGNNLLDLKREKFSEAVVEDVK